ncbi:hypothetical protein ACXIVK_31785 [Paraburkholderia caledonica]
MAVITLASRLRFAIMSSRSNWGFACELVVLAVSRLMAYRLAGVAARDVRFDDDTCTGVNA